MDNISKLLGVNPPVVVEYETEKECSFPDLVMGMEIEVENVNRGAGDYTRLLTPHNWQVTTDGSLRGAAFEFVSHPMRLKNLMTALEKFYAVTGFTEHNFTDRCSIHVHVNATDMTVKQLSSLALVYSVFEESLFDFIGQSRDTNIYCIPWNQCRFNNKLLRNMHRYFDEVPRNWQKYTAVNLIPLRTQGSLEFRHMHGSADVEKIHKWLNMIGCLFRYAKENDFIQTYELIKSINAISNYEQFFNQVFQNYWRFDEDILRKLEAGVISAKYALVDFDPKAPVEAKTKKSTLKKSPLEAMWEANDAINIQQADIQLQQVQGAWEVRGEPEPAQLPGQRGRWIPPRAGRNLQQYIDAFGMRVANELIRRENQLDINHNFTLDNFDHLINTPEGLEI